MTEELNPYNPLAKPNLGRSIADALLERPTSSMPITQRFVGAGLYALYYTGDFDAYRPIAERNREGRFEMPIYVGKAIPKGGRKGGTSLDLPHGPNLFNRLAKHARSIDESGNLQIEDFLCRVLVVEDIFIPLGESLLINMFYPLWNVVIDGFGNNAPGTNRRTQQRSAWDTLHPGRAWAEALQPHPREEQAIIEDIRAYYEHGFEPGGSWTVSTDDEVEEE